MTRLTSSSWLTSIPQLSEALSTKCLKHGKFNTVARRPSVRLPKRIHVESIRIQIRNRNADPDGEIFYITNRNRLASTIKWRPLVLPYSKTGRIFVFLTTVLSTTVLLGHILDSDESIQILIGSRQWWAGNFLKVTALLYFLLLKGTSYF